MWFHRYNCIYSSGVCDEERPRRQLLFLISGISFTYKSRYVMTKPKISCNNINQENLVCDKHNFWNETFSISTEHNYL